MQETNRKNLSQEVYEQMLRNITNKVWCPGDRLPPEKDLMQQFAVSRITIREAIRQMVSLGLLKTIQGSGTYVCEYTPEVFGASIATPMYLCPHTKQDILNVLNVRMLESIVAGQAAKCSTEEGVRRLEEIHAVLAADGCSLETHVKMDIAFHMEICNMTGNPLMTQVCQAIYSALQSVMPTISEIMGTGGAKYYHAKLIDTIRKHYVYEAKQTMEEHILDTIRAVESLEDDSEVFASADRLELNYKQTKEREMNDMGDPSVDH